MKKLFKSLLVVACVGAIGAGVAAMAACGGATYTGEAYSLTHGTNRFIGYSSITIDKDGNVKKLTLTEVDLPTQVKGSDESVYVEVKYDDVTMKYNAEEKAYYVGDVTMTAFFADEAKCEAYYKAAIGNKITGKTEKGKEESITKSVLSKEENNYWTCDKLEDGSWDNHAQAPYSKDAYSRWKWNRDNTVAYVKKNGVAGLVALSKDDKTKTVTDPQGNSVVVWADANGVSTGATWSDLAGVKNGYLSYSQLIMKAFTVAAAKVEK